MKLHPITTMKLGKSMRKGYQIYAMQVGYSNTKEKIASLENIPVVQEFLDVFLENIQGLCPKQDLNFTINIIRRVAPISMTPYRMSTPELTELKMKLQELLEGLYMTQCISLRSTLLFVKKKGGTLCMCIDYHELKKNILKNLSR